jgi:hypothetical protein
MAIITAKQVFALQEVIQATDVVVRRSGEQPKPPTQARMQRKLMLAALARLARALDVCFNLDMAEEAQDLADERGITDALIDRLTDDDVQETVGHMNNAMGIEGGE